MSLHNCPTLKGQHATILELGSVDSVFPPSAPIGPHCAAAPGVTTTNACAVGTAGGPPACGWSTQGNPALPPAPSRVLRHSAAGLKISSTSKGIAIKGNALGF